MSGTLDVAGDVDVNRWDVCGDCIGRVTGDPDNKFTVAGGTGNTVVAGTLNATGATTLSSTLDVAGDVDVNSKFAVTASDGSLAIRRTSSRWPAARATRWWREPWSWRATWT